MTKSLAAALAACSLLVSACGRTVYGPDRMVRVGVVQPDSGNSAAKCDKNPGGAPGELDLSDEFVRLACASLADPTNPLAARQMMDAGITLNRVRCADFFVERSGHQMQARIVQGLVTPISAMLTGIIALASFKSDAGRKEVVQILGIGQTATVAGLALYQSEFLFAAENVNSVRTLTLRALNEHQLEILPSGVGFFGAARHLIDHQMICTPANILELSQAAIRSGRIVPAANSVSVNLGPDNAPAAVLEAFGSALNKPDFSVDELGSLWWLNVLDEENAFVAQQTLAVLHARFAALPVNPVVGTAGSYSIDKALLTSFRPLLARLPDLAKARFAVTRREIEARINKMPAQTDAAAIVATKAITFMLPVQDSGAKEQVIEP